MSGCIYKKYQIHQYLFIIYEIRALEYGRKIFYDKKKIS